ncbi:MAG: roadblock/LC7 domain-containing protein [Rhodoglobus sp.]
MNEHAPIDEPALDTAQASHRNPTVVSQSTETLQGLRDSCRSLVFATLLTDDGFEVCSLGGAENNRMASMASSLQALGDAVARELRIGAGEYIIIASERGHVIQMRIPGQPIVLSALFGGEETLGKALSVSRLSVSRLSEMLSVTP